MAGFELLVGQIWLGIALTVVAAILVHSCNAGSDQHVCSVGAVLHANGRVRGRGSRSTATAVGRQAADVLLWFGCTVSRAAAVPAIRISKGVRQSWQRPSARPRDAAVPRASAATTAQSFDYRLIRTRTAYRCMGTQILWFFEFSIQVCPPIPGIA